MAKGKTGMEVDSKDWLFRGGEGGREQGLCRNDANKMMKKRISKN